MQENNLQELINDVRTLRTLMQADPHRPTYHFVAPEGYTFPFDPNGAIYWKGKYHLGFIYQTRPMKEYSASNGHVWGHAVSTDLLHWTLYPDMLNVTEGDPEIGIFSGGAFLSKDGIPHLIYYGLGAKANLIARAVDDDLKVWRKLPTPALQEDTPPTCGFTVFDPHAWYDNKSDCYYQISGGMKPGLYKSKDLREWTCLGDVISGDDKMRYPFEDIACPDFFSVGDKSVLLFISHPLGAQYYIGNFSNDRFTPERHGRMNWPGGTFFAMERLQDAKGRHIMWGWIMQKHTPAHLQDYGWSGIMSLPRVLSLDDEGILQINPPDEIDLIRLQERREDDIALQPNEEKMLQTSGKSIELKIEITGGTHSPFGIKVFASPDGREETIIRYEPEQEQLVIDFMKSSITGPVSLRALLTTANKFPGFDPETNESHRSFLDHVSEQKAPLKLKHGEALKLDIFLDRSVIEVFANGRQAMTQLVYPELESSTRVAVFTGDGAVAVKDIQSWTLAKTNAC